MAKKNTLGQKVIGLEDREPILYGFINDLRKWTLELREEHKDTVRRIQASENRILASENEVSEVRELIRAVNTLHSDSQKRILQNEKRITQNEDGLALMQKMQETMNERLIRLEDRKNGSHKK